MHTLQDSKERAALQGLRPQVHSIPIIGGAYYMITRLSAHALMPNGPIRNGSLPICNRTELAHAMSGQEADLDIIWSATPPMLELEDMAESQWALTFAREWVHGAQEPVAGATAATATATATAA